MSGFSLEDCDSWSRLSSVTSESPVTTHVFVVENFEEIMKESKIGTAITSAKFKVEDTDWRIQVHPAGHREQTQDFIEISILNENEQGYIVKGSMACCGKKLDLFLDEPVPPNCFRGWNKFIRKADCLKNLVNKELHVKAEVSIVRKGETKVVSGKGMIGKKENTEASKLMESIYTSKVYADFKIVTNGTEFDCHKNFIASQSETFKNVIDRWAPEGKMTMDEHTPEVVKNLLNHCYRRPLEESVFDAYVVEFLNIGEKYDLPDLKLKAEIFMISNMKNETFIEFLVASDLFKAPKVKETALKYLSTNKSIWNVNSKEWKGQLKGKDDLFAEIITALCS